MLFGRTNWLDAGRLRSKKYPRRQGYGRFLDPFPSWPVTLGCLSLMWVLGRRRAQRGESAPPTPSPPHTHGRTAPLDFPVPTRELFLLASICQP